MKQLLLPFLAATVMAASITETHAVRYRAFEVSGTQTMSYIGSSDTASVNIDSYSTVGSWTHIYLPTAHLSKQKKEYNLEWLDLGDTITYPAQCRFTDEWVALNNGIRITTYLDRNGAGTEIDLYANVADLHSTNNAAHKEPLNRAATGTGKTVRVPSYIECDPGLGTTIEAAGNGHVNAQIWWDGTVPNNRTTTQRYTIKYRIETNFSAAFKPDTISLVGPVGAYIPTNSVLLITTTGGTKVEIAWPDVNLIEYYNEGMWTGGHKQVVPVTDGTNQVEKRIRVRGEVSGPTTISVPVTMTLS